MAEVQPPPARAVPASGNSEPLFIVVLPAPCRRRYRRVLRELAYRAAPVPTFGCGSSKSAVVRPGLAGAWAGEDSLSPPRGLSAWADAAPLALPRLVPQSRCHVPGKRDHGRALFSTPSGRRSCVRSRRTPIDSAARRRADRINAGYVSLAGAKADQFRLEKMAYRDQKRARGPFPASIGEIIIAPETAWQ
jgi:hypothetical protein